MPWTIRAWRIEDGSGWMLDTRVRTHRSFRGERVPAFRKSCKWDWTSPSIRVETLCRAVDIDPSDRRALGFLGKMIGVAPDLSVEVRKRLEKFAKIYPNNPAANYYYALSLRQTPGTNRQAEALFN